MALIEIPQVLTIAGIDSSGGAGVNADTRVFALEGVYAATAITGLTAQNTYGVQAAEVVTPTFLSQQLISIFSDLEVKAIKTGALFDLNIVQTLANDLVDVVQEIPLVVDPVMVAKGGAKLLTDEAIAALISDLVPLAYLITPNMVEAEVMTGISIQSQADMVIAAERIQKMGAQHVLIKGGHMPGNQLVDLLYTQNGVQYWYESERVDTARTHGTGDTLSAFITARLAMNMSLDEIMPLANQYMKKVITNGIAVGHGHGPLNHWAK